MLGMILFREVVVAALREPLREASIEDSSMGLGM